MTELDGALRPPVLDKETVRQVLETAGMVEARLSSPTAPTKGFYLRAERVGTGQVDYRVVVMYMPMLTLTRVRTQEEKASDAAIERQMLASYQMAIQEAGFEVTLIERGKGPQQARLVVSI